MLELNREKQILKSMMTKPFVSVLIDTSTNLPTVKQNTHLPLQNVAALQVHVRSMGEHRSDSSACLVVAVDVMV